jgi:shikimate dehydrogenase
VRASEIFLGRDYPEGTTERLYGKILRSKENIVLTGMPASGKTRVGKLLSERLDRPFIDLDAEIVKYAGKSIPEIFSEGGESLFRNIETEVIRKIAPVSGAVIATGGGAVLRDENVRLLSQNGRIYFLDRPLEMLVPTSDRPLASTVADITERYNERYERYLSTADVRIENGGSAEEAAEKILGDFI